eukprot:352875-Chlamydomonas_euryale.AAC.1
MPTLLGLALLGTRVRVRSNATGLDLRRRLEQRGLEIAHKSFRVLRIWCGPGNWCGLRLGTAWDLCRTLDPLPPPLPLPLPTTRNQSPHPTQNHRLLRPAVCVRAALAQPLGDRLAAAHGAELLGSPAARAPAVGAAYVRAAAAGGCCGRRHRFDPGWRLRTAHAAAAAAKPCRAAAGQRRRPELGPFAACAHTPGQRRRRTADGGAAREQPRGSGRRVAACEQPRGRAPAVPASEQPQHSRSRQPQRRVSLARGGCGRSGEEGGGGGQWRVDQGCSER